MIGQSRLTACAKMKVSMASLENKVSMASLENLDPQTLQVVFKIIFFRSYERNPVVAIYFLAGLWNLFASLNYLWKLKCCNIFITSFCI